MLIIIIFLLLIHVGDCYFPKTHFNPFKNQLRMNTVTNDIIPPLKKEKPLKILLLVEPTPFTYISGYANRFKEMLSYLKQAGDIVHILTPDETIDPPNNFLGYNITNIKGFRFPLYKQVLCSFDFGLKTREIIKSFKPDIIHVSTPSALVWPASFWSWKYRIPLVMSYHTNFPEYAKTYAKFKGAESFANFLLYNFHKLADLTLCTSPQLKDEMIKINVPNVDVWLKGINAERFHPKYYDNEMRTKLSNNNNNEVLLLYVGRLGHEKKLNRLKNILDAIPNVRLAFVGKGPAENDLKELYKGYNNVNFVGELVGNSLSQAFASADIFMMPSDSETLGFVAIEAMSSGKPVIGVKAGGLIDIIENDVNGYLVDNNDNMLEFIDRTKQLVNNNELRLKLGQFARKWAEGFSWETATSKLRNIQYRQAITNFNEKIEQRKQKNRISVDVENRLNEIGQYYRPDLA